jgi:Leucine-rich repeat (LRR) protein
MEEDRSIQVKFMLAGSSGRLDLSECGLTVIPPAVFDLVELEELSLAGNQLRELSADVGRLTALKRLQLAGNELESLPESIGALTALEGAWLHGNRLAALPEALGALTALAQLSLAGNSLQVGAGEGRCCILGATACGV